MDKEQTMENETIEEVTPSLMKKNLMILLTLCLNDDALEFS